jgi:hypothetical protein
MLAARGLRFYRQAQFCESRICGVEPCGLRAPQGETCHARLLAQKFKFSTGINRKLNMHQPLHVGFEVIAEVLL